MNRFELVFVPAEVGVARADRHRLLATHASRATHHVRHENLEGAACDVTRHHVRAGAREVVVFSVERDDVRFARHDAAFRTCAVVDVFPFAIRALPVDAGTQV